MLVEHTDEGENTDKQEWTVAVLFSNETGNRLALESRPGAKFSRSFLEHTQWLYNVRARLLYPDGAVKKWLDFIKSENAPKRRGPGENGAPHY